MITLPLAATIPTVAGYPVAVLPGYTLCFPLELLSGKAVDVAVAQMGMRQDYTLRVWVSADMATDPLVLYPRNAVDFHPSRGYGTTLRVYDGAFERPPVPAALPLPPANYFVNVQNLTNGVNHFSILLTQTDLPDNT